jgi:hypothetical protein
MFRFESQSWERIFFLLWKLCAEYQESWTSYIYKLSVSSETVHVKKMFNIRIVPSAKFPWGKITVFLHFIKEAQGASKLIWQKFSNIPSDAMILHLRHLQKFISTYNKEYMLNSWKSCCEGSSERNQSLHYIISRYIFTHISFKIV